MDVSIIMINYNTFELTKNAIESVKKHTLKNSYEIILVDNASTDGSVESLPALFPELKYVFSKENDGTSKAFNKGLKLATGKYVLWLNTDVLFTDDFIGKLYDFAEKTPDCGICGGNLLAIDGTPTHSYRRKVLTPHAFCHNERLFVRLFRKIFKKQLSEQYNYSDKPIKVGYVTGADFFVRKELFDKLGGFDERIFMYAEEVEFTYRMLKNTDYKSYNLPSAKMIHLEGASFNGKTSFSERRTRLMLLGNAEYLAIHFGNASARKYIKFMSKAFRRRARVYALYNKQKAEECFNCCAVAKKTIAEEIFSDKDCNDKKVV